MAQIEKQAMLPDNASLNQTKGLLSSMSKRLLKEKGVEIVDVTLHVGLGTFRPVSENDITNHDMHSELYEISESVAERLNLAKKENRRKGVKNGFKLF